MTFAATLLLRWTGVAPDDFTTADRPFTVRAGAGLPVGSSRRWRAKAEERVAGGGGATR